MAAKITTLHLLVLSTLCYAWGFNTPITYPAVRYLSATNRIPTLGRSRLSVRLNMAEVKTEGPTRDTSIRTLQLFSPAKTNLFLRITKKRNDGFHELASVFQALGLGDTLTFERVDDGGSQDILSCNEPSVPLDGKNLVVKAFSLFRIKTGIQTHFRCDIEKRTPLEGGMGGGSSNAATALWAANKLCGSPASDASLIEWGGELGRLIAPHSHVFKAGFAAAMLSELGMCEPL